MVVRMPIPYPVLEDICFRLTRDPTLAAQLTAPLGFSIQGEGGGEWTLVGGASPKLEVGILPGISSITMSSQLFIDIFQHGVNPQPAFLRGEILVSGELSPILAMAALLPEAAST